MADSDLSNVAGVNMHNVEHMVCAQSMKYFAIINLDSYALNHSFAFLPDKIICQRSSKIVYRSRRRNTQSRVGACIS